MNAAIQSAPSASTISSDDHDQEQLPPGPSDRGTSVRTGARLENARSFRFQSLLVPLDGSRIAEHAIPWAMDIAGRSGGYVRFIHVNAPDTTGGCGLSEEREREEYREYIGRVAERITRTSRVPVAPLIVDAPDVAVAITEAGRSADMIVMATRRRRTTSRFSNDGVIAQVLHRATSPLLITPGYDFPVQRAVPKPIRRISIPLNGDAESEVVLGAAAELSFLTAAECRLVRVLSGPSYAGAMGNRKQYDALAYLNHIAFELSSLASPVSAEIVSSNEAIGEAILANARASDIDLIAVASRGTTKLSKCPVSYLVGRSHVPILVALTTPQNLASRKLTRSMSCAK